MGLEKNPPNLRRGLVCRAYNDGRRAVDFRSVSDFNKDYQRDQARQEAYRVCFGGKLKVGFHGLKTPAMSRQEIFQLRNYNKTMVIGPAGTAGAHFSGLLY